MIEFYSQNVPGYFSDGDFEFYQAAFNDLPNEGKIVEIGSFKGRSSSFMATLIANSEKKISFFCVDTWEGSEEHQAGKSAEDQDVVNHTLYDVFIKNMEPVKDFYFPIRRESVKAAELFGNETLDMVFIDASHDYENVKADLLAWIPKVKKGGVISGHDCFYPDILKALSETIENFQEIKYIGLCWYIHK